jgi:hypothetical protein
MISSEERVMISSEDETDQTQSLSRTITESSDDESPRKVKRLRKKYPSIERLESDDHAGNVIEQVDAESNDSTNSLPSDFEEDILSCGGNCQIPLIEATAGIGDDNEAVQYLYCYLCGISKPADRFSDAQQEEAELEESSYCLIHHQGIVTYDESTNLSVSTEISESEDDMHDDSPVMDFGKHQGKSYNYILNNDYSYCMWALGITESPSYKLKMFQKWIRGMGVS